MFGLRDRVVPALWTLYAAQDRGARGSAGDRWWVSATGPLTADEIAALELLAEHLNDGHAFRNPLVITIGRGERPADVALNVALDKLAPRAARVYDAAAPMLDRWAGALRARQPAWVEQLGTTANVFYRTDVGAAEPFEYGLFLLPAEPDRAGQFGTFFVPGEGSSLECAGEPNEAALDHLRHALLHAVLHRCQSERADALLRSYLESPAGRRTADRFEGSPAAARQQRLFGASLQGLVPHLSETVVHALAYEGVLREAAGSPPAADHWDRIASKAQRVLDAPGAGWTEEDLYDAWILGGSAQLVPLARRYLTEARTVDADFARCAFESFDALYGSWKAGTRPA